MSRITYSNIMLVRPDDPEYLGFMARMAAANPPRGGPRQAGEMLGGLTELCVRHIIASLVDLQAERILSSYQQLRNGRYATLYRELDAVWRIDEESLCLFEFKFTYAENMQRAAGLRQLDKAAEILFMQPENKYVLQRLVYIETERVDVFLNNDDDIIPVVDISDAYTELGVIWITPEQIEQTALELEITLPENWREPEAKEGVVEDADKDEWAQFADTSLADDSPVETPMQTALRIAMEGR